MQGQYKSRFRLHNDIFSDTNPYIKGTFSFTIYICFISADYKPISRKFCLLRMRSFTQGGQTGNPPVHVYMYTCIHVYTYTHTLWLASADLQSWEHRAYWNYPMRKTRRVKVLHWLLWISICCYIIIVNFVVFHLFQISNYLLFNSQMAIFRRVRSWLFLYWWQSCQERC